MCQDFATKQPIAPWLAQITFESFDQMPLHFDSYMDMQFVNTYKYIQRLPIVPELSIITQDVALARKYSSLIHRYSFFKTTQVGFTDVAFL